MNLISAQHIHKQFGTGDLATVILKDISLTVAEGEFLGIMGKSGAGKSTLLYQLSLLDLPTSGTVTIDGTDTATLNEVERTAFRLNTLGYVFQDYALVPDLNAEENVILPLLMRGRSWTSAHAAAHQALDAVGLTGKYLNLPGELSGGEKQRVAIARATVGKPRILFADEPTANLDSVSGAQVIELITNLNQEHGQTIVMVTHEKEYARNCERILYMEDGKLIT